MSPGRYGQDEGCIVANRSQRKKARKDADVVAVNQLPAAPPDLSEEDPTYVTGEYDDEDTVATAEDKMQASAPTIHIPVITADSEEDLDLAGGDSDESSLDEPTRAIPQVAAEELSAAASSKSTTGAASKVPNPGQVAAMAKSAREEKARQDAEQSADREPEKPATAESLADALNDGYERHGSQGPGTTDSLMPKVVVGAIALGVVTILVGLRKKRKRRRLEREQAALEG